MKWTQARNEWPSPDRRFGHLRLGSSGSSGAATTKPTQFGWRLKISAAWSGQSVPSDEVEIARPTTEFSLASASTSRSPRIFFSAILSGPDFWAMAMSGCMAAKESRDSWCNADFYIMPSIENGGKVCREMHCKFL